MRTDSVKNLITIALGALVVSACTVKLQAPDKPIHIIGDFTIKHEIVVKVENELDAVLTEDSGLF